METLDTEGLLERDRKLGLWLLTIGVAAAAVLIPDLMLGWFEPGYLIGIACGGLGGGIGTLIRYLTVRGNAKAKRAYASQFDERLVFIRSRAKSTAYDVTFYTLCGSVFFSSIIDWSAWQMGVTLLLVAFAAYMAGLAVLQRKY